MTGKSSDGFPSARLVLGWLMGMGCLLLCSCELWYQRGRQQDYLKSVSPTETFEAPKAAPEVPEVRDVGIRVYADAAFRRQLNWKGKFELRLDRVNNVLSQFGIRLKVVDYWDWKRESPDNSPEQMLVELQTKEPEPPPNIVWVVGLVSANQGFTSNQHIGLANILGRHFVVRDMVDASEYDTLQRNLDLLSSAEKESAYNARKAHKEVSVFLHEWAHTLGAVHIRGDNWIMNPEYSHRLMEFCPQNQEIIRLGLKQLLSDHLDLAGWRKELLAFLRTADQSQWDLAAFKRMIADLDSPAQDVTIDRSPQDVALFNKAVELANKGKIEEAWTALELLIVRYPTDANVLSLSCHVSARRDLKADSTREQCSKATARSDATRYSWRALAMSLLERKETEPLVDALAATRKAHLEAKDVPREDWLLLSELHSLAGYFTYAEQFLDRAGDGPENRERRAAIQTARHRVGLARGVTLPGMTPDREGVYTTRVLEMFNAFTTAPSERTIQNASALLKDYPDIPGPLAAMCEVERLRNHRKQARSLCEKALKIDAEAIYAHFSLGLLDVTQNKTDAAVRHMRQAIVLDPQWKDPWTVLQRVYGALGRKDDLRKLNAEYDQQFSDNSKQ